MSFQAFLALIIVYVVWGGTFAAIRIGVDTFPTALLPCLRFIIAGLIILAYCWLKGEKRPSKADIKTHCIIGALLFALSNATVCWTVQHITTGLGALLLASTPFWMVWMSSLTPPHEKISPQALLGVLIGFVGMIVLLLPKLLHLNGISWLYWISVLVSFLSAFNWAAGSIYARKHPTPDTSLMMGLGIQTLFAGLLLAPVCLFTIHDWRAIHPSAASWWALTYLIFLGSILATGCYLFTLKTLPVTLSSTFAYVSPVLTVLFGCLLLHESVSLTTIIGASIIMFGVVVVQSAAIKRIRQPLKINCPT